MFDAVRNNKRIVQVFLALITLPFAFWGVESYVSNSGMGNDVAVVGDRKITAQEYQQALREQEDQLRKALGDNFNKAMLDTPSARFAMLDQLINQRLLLIEAQKNHIVASDDLLRSFIADIPALQEGGKFSMARYEELLRAQGMSQQGFEQQLRQDLTLRQLAGAVGDTSILAQTSANALLSAMAEKRTVQETLFLPAAFAAQVKLSDEEVKKYYEAYPLEFQEPEQARAEYVVLSLSEMKNQVKVSDAEIKALFDQRKDLYQQPEERRARHILISAEKANTDARTKAKAKAADLLLQAKAKPSDFGKLAKQHSQDPGSAASDGDLGFFARGMMVKPFEDTAFSLKEDEISDLVETDFGYHIIQLTGVKAAKGKALEEVRAEVEAEIKQQSAQKRYAEAVDSFTNMVYEQSDSLKPVADKFQLAIQQSSWLIKGVPALPGSPLANPKLATALFSADAVKNKRNTEAVEIASNTLVAARVLEHKPTIQKPFASVMPLIRDRLLMKEASALAVKAGEAKLSELKTGKATEEPNWAIAQAVGRTAPGTLARESIKAVFHLPSTKLPGYTGITLPAGGYALYKLNSVDTSAKLEENIAKGIRNEMAEVISREEMSAYLLSLREKYKVEVNKAAMELK